MLISADCLDAGAQIRQSKPTNARRNVKGTAGQDKGRGDSMDSLLVNNAFMQGASPVRTKLVLSNPSMIADNSASNIKLDA